MRNNSTIGPKSKIANQVSIFRTNNPIIVIVEQRSVIKSKFEIRTMRLYLCHHPHDSRCVEFVAYVAHERLHALHQPASQHS